jgi:hypothetical protein
MTNHLKLRGLQGLKALVWQTLNVAAEAATHKANRKANRKANHKANHKANRKAQMESSF